jgi:hypothetical protein
MARNNGTSDGFYRGAAGEGPVIYLPDGSTRWLRMGRPNGNGHGLETAAAFSAAGETAGPVPEHDIEFARLTDGIVLELVRAEGNPGGLKLLVWRGTAALLVDSYEHEGKRYVPRVIDPHLQESLRLPAGVSGSGDAAELLRDVVACLHRYVDLPKDAAELAGSFVLHTWIADRSPTASYLWLAGPYASGKTTLLQLLQCLCRRAVLVGDVSPAFLYSLPSRIRPTLLIDEFDGSSGSTTRHIERLLRNGSTRGVRVGRAKQLYDVFGPKVIASSLPPCESGLASRAIVISMVPSERVLQKLDPEAMERLASEFQPRLLMFRLRHQSSSFPQLDAANLTPRIRDMARALAAPLAGAPELQERLLAHFENRDHEARIDRASGPEAIILQAVFRLCHHHNGHMSVSRIAAEAERVAAEVGEWQRFAPRRVGNILRSLGLPTSRLGSWGRGVRLEEVRKPVHALFRPFGLLKAHTLDWQTVQAGYGGAPCRLCEQYDLFRNEDGTRLRCIEPHQPKKGKGLFEREEV